MVRAQYLSKTGVVFLLITVGGYGCGSKKAEEPPPAFGQLNTIARVYALATENLDHPPQNKDEFMPFLKDALQGQEDGNPEDALRPKVDLDAFVIHWGVDCRDLPRGRPAEWPVLAYEKQSKNGKRYVLRFRMVREVTDEELSSLPFPRGYNPPP
jgi:hypothetical protein